MNNDASTPSLMDQLKQSFWLRSPNRTLRALIFEYALVSAFNGQDISAIAGNLFGGLGAFIMASLAWLTFILLGIYAPAIKPLALSAAFFTFTWIAGQATNQYYATGKAKEPQVIEPISEEKRLQIAGGGTDLKRRRILMGLVATGSLITVLREAFRPAPPTLVGNLIYAHTGQLWTFVDYSGDVILGHFVSVYKSAVDQDKEQLAS